MEEKESEGRTIASDGPLRSSRWSRPIRRRCGSFFGLGLSVVGALLATEQRGVAQALTTPDSARLTVRPREMATGTRTAEAGTFTMNSLFEPSSLFVPNQCVGTRRCPLLVVIDGQGAQYQAAEKYGIILFRLDRFSGTEPVTSKDIKALDASLKFILQNYAIDPDKIAIMGRCHSGPPALFIGGLNLDVFSRILSISGAALPPVQMDPQNKTTEFFIDAGYEESIGEFGTVQVLRRMGHPVKHVVAIRDHSHQAEDYDFMGRWLQESWATPNPTARPVPSVVADPLPVLTTEAVTGLTKFWENFKQESDSIQTDARWEHLREVIMPVGDERPSVWMTDMAALAAASPEVATDLKNAGLTAQQHDAYRAALLSAKTARRINGMLTEAAADPEFALHYLYWFWESRKDGPPHVLNPLPTRVMADTASVLGKNIAFLATHPNELAALEATGIWSTP